MIFSSLEFWLILFLCLLIYYNIPSKYRWIVLLAGSILFIGYLSFSFLVYALVFSIANYFFGHILQIQTNNSLRKKLYLLFLILNVGQLVFFKYIDFLIDNINGIFSVFASKEIQYLEILVPIGISYYTFQCIGYIINIYRKIEQPEKHFGYFLIYNLFFPKFLSGPIERSEKFLPQLHNPGQFSPGLIKAGFKLIFIGLFKKLVIADRLFVVVDNVYDNLTNYSGSALVIVLFIQAAHIYTDFSGYTDIALGLGKLFGFNLTNNFNRPFFATNVSNFWRRWHISLTTWCTDYIFKSIIYKRRRWGNIAAVYGVFITFLIIGIWHGPRWTYIILGFLHGLAINYEFFTKRRRLLIGSRIPVFWNNTLSRIITFVFFSFTLIFFNANDLKDSFYFLVNLFNFQEYRIAGNAVIMDSRNFIIAIIAFLLLFMTEIFKERGRGIIERIHSKPIFLRWSFYYILVLIVLIFGQFNAGNFVYFQF